MSNPLVSIVMGSDSDLEIMREAGKALPAWNEGVGEHVRTRFHRPSGNWAVGPVKLRTAVGIRTERRKPVSSAGPAFDGRELPQITIQPFDLMSRRHPLSST